MEKNNENIPDSPYYRIKYLFFLAILVGIILFDSILLLGWWYFWSNNSGAPPNWFPALNDNIFLCQFLLVFISYIYIVIVIVNFGTIKHLIKITLFFTLSTISVHIGFFLQYPLLGDGIIEKFNQLAYYFTKTKNLPYGYFLPHWHINYTITNIILLSLLAFLLITLHFHMKSKNTFPTKKILCIFFAIGTALGLFLETMV